MFKRIYTRENALLPWKGKLPTCIGDYFYKKIENSTTDTFFTFALTFVIIWAHNKGLGRHALGATFVLPFLKESTQF